MKIVLPGGSGQVGQVLARSFSARGHEVVILSRRPTAAPWRVVGWDSVSRGPWAAELDGADVVINLAGRSVNCRYTPANRAEIKESRVVSTRVIGDAIAAAARPPALWLQSSTATIYSHRYDAPNDEVTGKIGGTERSAPDTWRFSIEVATAWENAATEVPLTDATRLVLMRSAMIMSPDAGGVFDTLLGLVRAGLGGTSGDGRQYVSWIHDADFVAAIDWIIARDHVHGAVNIASPNPLPNAAFMRALREAWGARIGLPAMDWMLEIGALAMQSETELVLKSRRVVPGLLLADGFRFSHALWPDAARELCSRWRASRR